MEFHKRALVRSRRTWRPGFPRLARVSASPALGSDSRVLSGSGVGRVPASICHVLTRCAEMQASQVRVPSSTTAMWPVWVSPLLGSWGRWARLRAKAVGTGSVFAATGGCHGDQASCSWAGTPRAIKRVRGGRGGREQCIKTWLATMSGRAGWPVAGSEAAHDIQAAPKMHLRTVASSLACLTAAVAGSPLRSRQGATANGTNVVSALWDG